MSSATTGPGSELPAGTAPTDAEQEPGSLAATSLSGLRSEVAQAADFSEIRYSQSWEDPRSLQRALQPGPGDTVLSIAAAGDNSFALLLMGDGGPDRVVSVDLNPAQCALVELKRAALLELDHDELLRFLGLEPAVDRAQLYARIRGRMPTDARGWWDRNTDLVTAGVLHVGKLERYFATFRSRVLPVTHGHKQLRSLFDQRDVAERAIYHDEEFDNRRWRAMLRVFLSRPVLGRLGRDPSFFEHVALPSVGAHYAERTRHALAVLDPSQNPFVQWIMLGRYLDEQHGHPYLDPANHELLRERLDRLEVRCDELERHLAECSPGTYDKFNLSDIFEWMSPDLYEQTLRALVRSSRPGGRLAYWNNLVLRSRPPSMAHLLEPQPDLASAIHHDDRSFLYRAFQVEVVTRLPEER